MEEKELQNIAQVIHNMIYNKNIATYEKLNREDLVLNSFEISVLDIVMAIYNNEDLNNINGINIKNFIQSDLNKFLTFVAFIREYSIESYISVIRNAEEDQIDIFPFWIPKILECFTYEEGIAIKKEFLKKITHFSGIDELENKNIDDFYFSEMENLHNTLEKIR